MAELAQISPIGFGAFKIGRNQGIKYDAAYALPDLPTAQRLLNGVLDLGINYIDTAPAYGLSEERIGQTIAHRRAEYLLATKVGELFENGESRYDFSRAGMSRSVTESLRRLRTESVDVLWLHSSRDDLRVLQQTDAVETLVQLKQKGQARAIGLSGYTAEALSLALPWCDAIMVTYHPQDTELADVMRQAAARGISVIVKKGLASGRLPAADAIRFILGNDAVASVVVGSLSIEHMEENLEIARHVRLPSKAGE